MIITNSAFAAVLPATTDKDRSRFFLNAVAIEPDGRVVATNGHVLLTARSKAVTPDEDFPVVPGATFNGNPASQVLVHADIVTSILAAMPKSARGLPICRMAQLSTNGSPMTYTLAATDLSAPRIATIAADHVQTFPAYDRIYQSCTKTATTSLGVPVLEALIKSAKAVGAAGITFTIPAADPTGAIVSSIRVAIDGSDTTVDGVIMPMRA